MNVFKTFLIALVVIAAILPMRVAAQWAWHNPDPEANEYFDAAIVGDDRAWFVGENGSIIHSSDAGASWQTIANPLRGTPLVLLSIIFTDPQTALISANNGNILRSLDGGITWQLLSPPDVDVQRLKRAPDGAIWGYGSNGAIARTSDVGDSWEEFAPGTTTIVYDLAFPDNNNVLAACGEGKLLRSTDIGQTWTETVPHVQRDLISIAFIDADRGFMLQRDKILLRTSDGGQTWSDTTLTVSEMRQIRFADENVGWILTNSIGNVYKTTDGGQSWNIVAVDPTTNYTLRGVLAVTADNAIMYGIGGGIFLTADGGQTWDQQGFAISRRSMNAVTALDENTAWVFGDNAALFSSDAGQSWTANLAPPGQSFRIGYALSATRLVGGGNQGEIYLSTDAGLNWDLVETLTGAGAIEEFDFVDQNYGWCVGPHGTIGRTTNGGETWQSLDPMVTHDFHGISARSATEAWVVGNGGTMYFTTDGGQNWSLRALSTQSNLRAIRFVNDTDAWAGGEFILLRSTNGGTSWDRIITTGLDVVYDIAFTDDTTGFFLGSRSLLRTKDGGDSFYRTDYPGSHLNDVDPLNNGYAWLASGFGGVLRYTPAPVIRVVPSFIDYGDVATNRFSDKTFEIHSVGEVPLNVTNISTHGQYYYIDGETRLMAPGAIETITIRFEPQTIGIDRGLAFVESNAVMGLGVVDLLGNGITPLPPAFSHSPDTLDLGTVRLCDLLEAYIQIENVSQKNILVDSATFVGGDSASFLVSQPPSGFFPPGKKDSIGVLFVPRTMGPLSSTLTVASNDAGEPYYRIHVHGVGINPVLSSDRDEVNFGYVYEPQSATETITITNNGSAPLIIHSWQISGPDATDFSITKEPVSPVAIGMTTEIGISYTAAEPYTQREATLTLESDDCLMLTKDITLRARATSTGIETGNALPDGVVLSQNYPNPFSASMHGATALTMTLPVQADVTVSVYNTLGRKVRTLIRGSYPAGSHALTLGASGLLPGTYFVELTASARNQTTTKRVRAVLTR